MEQGWECLGLPLGRTGRPDVGKDTRPMGGGAGHKCRELKTSSGSQGTTAARVDPVARHRPRATPALTPCACPLPPWQINVLQAKKKFEILDSVSAW